MFYSGDQLRAMYPGGRGNAKARWYAQFWAAVQGAGLLPRRWVTLEVAGRRTGRIARFPLGMADWQGHWYLVSMLGNDCNRVRNVRAASGRVMLRHGSRRAYQLDEVRSPSVRRSSSDIWRKYPAAARTSRSTGTHPWPSSRRSRRDTPSSGPTRSGSRSTFGLNRG
jgi:hypothetical protein